MTAAGKNTSKGKAGKDKATDGQRASWRLLAVAWFIPGSGHRLLGKKKRAIVFAVVILCGFVTGVLFGGEIGTPKPQSPFSWLAALACLGNGILSLGRLIWLNGVGGLLHGFPFAIQGGGNPSDAGFAYGNTFLYTAGLMNLLTILDVSDIARGQKD